MKMGDLRRIVTFTQVRYVPMPRVMAPTCTEALAETGTGHGSACVSRAVHPSQVGQRSLGPA